MIYGASKVLHADLWKRLRESGVPIISTWIDEAGEGQSGDYSELSTRCLAEVASAKSVILYCEPGEVLKGAMVEVGAALALGVPVYCVGTCDSLSRVFVKHPLWHTCPSIDCAIIACTGANCAGYERDNRATTVESTSKQN